jgi:hypothetical protein
VIDEGENLMSHKFKFPQAFVRIGEPDFGEVFLDELQQQEANLNLQCYCEEGWPDPESVELEIDSISRGNHQTIVSVSCRFNEVVTTSCSSVRFTPSGLGKFDFKLSLEDEGRNRVS